MVVTEYIYYSSTRFNLFSYLCVCAQVRAEAHVSEEGSRCPRSRFIYFFVFLFTCADGFLGQAGSQQASVTLLSLPCSELEF